jgi:hypothetical protein
MKRAKSFKNWTSDEVENAFNIQRVYKYPALLNWINDDYVLTDHLKNQLESIRVNLEEKVEYLNEEELKAHYLIPIIDLIGFDEFGKYRTFLGRPLSAERGDMLLNGVVDFMVATGKSDPDKPYFFLHEYKQELKRDNNPLGQLLIAMVAAQTRNENKKPIQGCYILGRFVFFVLFEDSQYSVSQAFDLTTDDIFRVAGIMQKSKAYIIEQVENLG